MTEKEILENLRKAQEKDYRYADGKIFSSMCTSPYPFAKKVIELFVDSNLGDSGLFKGTKELENEAVRMLGSLLNNTNPCGFILSGGTEANITALWLARNMYGKAEPEIVVPEAAHFSFEKACNILKLKMITASSNEDHSVNIDDVRKKISRNTIALVGIAGNTEYGAVDDIELLSEIALEKKLYLHVDAAFGGFVLPFLKELGYPIKKFDFSIEGVNSITIDPHKMGLAPVPSGGLLLRDAELLKHIETSSPYLVEKKHYTLLGTRSGASAAATYAVLRLMGREGYKRNVEHCMLLTLKLYNGLRNMELNVFEPKMNIVVFAHERQDAIADELLKKGWMISRTKKGEIRLVIMPHVREENVAALLKDLREILGI